MRPCGQCFRVIQRHLEPHPLAWYVRCLGTGRVWRNAAARRWLALRSPVTTWEKSLVWCHYQDVPRLEDAHSRALKTGQPQFLEFRVKLVPHRLSLVRSRLTSYRCPHHRSFILSVVEPV